MDLTDNYNVLLKNLLPRGPLWQDDDPLLLGLAESYARVHQHGDRLMIEIDPRTTTELIQRYEQLAGLPDSCDQQADKTLAQRQHRLDAKINIIGGINREFYLAQLAAMGYPQATITNFGNDLFRCTSTSIESLYSGEWHYWWQVNLPIAAKQRIMKCSFPCKSSLRRWGDASLECMINKICPSHTYVTFLYQD